MNGLGNMELDSLVLSFTPVLTLEIQSVQKLLEVEKGHIGEL